MESDSGEIDLSGKRLLLLKPSALGDVCQGAASAWALKRRWPDLHLAWLVNRSFEPLIAPLSCVDETIPFDRGRFRGAMGVARGAGELTRFVRRLREGSFDVALDMQGLLRTGLFALWSGARLRVGFSNAREGASLCYTHRVTPPGQPVHARARYDSLTRYLGCSAPEREDLDVAETEIAEVRGLLAEAGAPPAGPLIAVCPAARWETKIWPAGHFAAALDRIVEAVEGALPVLVGSPDMADHCAEVAAACRVAGPVNLCGRTSLRQLAALLELADLLLTCDSGPMHLAAAQGTPVVAVLGPTDPRRTGPWGQLENVVQGECEKMPCLKRRCPGLGLKCMKDLGPEAVVVRALGLLRMRERRNA